MVTTPRKSSNNGEAARSTAASPTLGNTSLSPSATSSPLSPLLRASPATSSSMASGRSKRRVTKFVIWGGLGFVVLNGLYMATSVSTSSSLWGPGEEAAAPSSTKPSSSSSSTLRRIPMSPKRPEQSSSATTSSSLFRPHPSEVDYNVEDTTRNTRLAKRRRIRRTKDDVALYKRILQTHDESSDDDSDDCVPMHDWQTHNYMVCNPIHELDLNGQIINDRMHYIHHGGDRTAWRVQDYNGTGLAFKTLRLDRKFNEYRFEISRKDGMTMERLTKSPYVISTFGYCGLSSVLELGVEGTAWDQMKRSRDSGKDDRTPLQKLRMVYQIAKSVADLHEQDVTHVDLDTGQFVLVDGIYKLSDFHLAVFLQKHKKTGKTCPDYVSYARRNWFNRAPEEDPDEPCDNKASDVFMLGNNLYYILTNLWLFEATEWRKQYSEKLRLVREGERSPFPRSLTRSKDPANRAMMKAIEMTWEHDVNKRASARQVANYLRKELIKIEPDIKRQDVVRVSVPPLPDDWDASLTDDFWPH